MLRNIVPMIIAIALAACDEEPRDATADVDASDVSGAVDVHEVTPEVIVPQRCELPADAAVSLPKDDMRHVAGTEWYYWTGHLQAEDGRWFGFHVTVVLAGPPGHGVMIGHHSITSAETDGPLERIADYIHGFEVGIEKAVPESGFAFDLGDLKVSGDAGEDVLELALEGARLSLTASDVRGPVVRHGNGFQDYGGGISTYYYARPRMAAEGTLEIGGEVLKVSGTAWFDHQWGALAPVQQSRWDWIAMQLDDGRELMVVQLPIPNQNGATFAFAELTEADCTTRTFYGDDVSFSGDKTWVSPTSGCSYPLDWTIEVGDMRFVLDPLADDQEMHAEPIPYWEGAATVSGAATGRAYVELVGYCH